ncbi:MAG: hypothetical protein R2727_08165 [Bacteroidales bacterium]
MRSLAALLVLLLLSFSSCKFFREKGWFGKNKADTLVAWQARQDSIRVADSVKAEIAYMKELEQARLDSVMKADAERLEWENRFRYNIIVGSFLTPEYAREHMERYRSMGYDARIIPDSRDRFNLVSAEVHESLSKAFERLARFQDTVEFEAWIFVRN